MLSYCFLTPDCSFKLLKVSTAAQQRPQKSRALLSPYIQTCYASSKQHVTEGFCHRKEKRKSSLLSWLSNIIHHIWTLSYDFPRSSKKTKSLSVNCHSSGRRPSETEITAQFICSVAPNSVNVPLMNVLFDCWSSVVVVSMTCSVLLFPELLPVSFNQEQQLACT